MAAATGEDATVDTLTPKCARRIKLDIREILKSPITGVSIEPDEGDYLTVHVLLDGPGDTPYENGFFYFIVKFPSNYPWSPPNVKLMTTGGGTVRFNPNLYSCGKVCLSILGTWFGPGWTPQMTLTTVLVSIQSLMNEKPSCNEPGHEEEKRPGDIQKYNKMVCHDTLRVAVLGMVKNSSSLIIPKSFRCIMETAFLERYHFYEDVAVKNIQLTGTRIVDPLYSYEKGYFRYDELLDELESVRKVVLSKLNQV